MNYQSQTETPGLARTRVLLAGLLFFTGGVALHLSSSPRWGGVGTPLETTPSTSSPERRSLSIALPDGGCKVTHGRQSETRIAPTSMASFPGSGSRMTWSLVEALTGIRTNNDYDSQRRGYENVVTVKTHYPVKNARRRFVELDPLFNRAIVILRNPIHSIPSYFNLQYEHLNHLPNHSTRGPNKDWIEYRQNANHGLPYQLPKFEEFVVYWMERYPARDQLLLVAYEDIVDAGKGPVVAAQIAHFLAETAGVDPIADESIPCVWETIVNYKKVATPSADPLSAPLPSVAEPSVDPSSEDPPFEDPPSEDPPTEGVQMPQDATENRRRLKYRGPSSLRTGPKERPYTEQNLGDIADVFGRLLEKYGGDAEFARIVASYVEVASNTVPEN